MHFDQVVAGGVPGMKQGLALGVRCDEAVERWVGCHSEFRIYLGNVSMWWVRTSKFKSRQVWTYPEYRGTTFTRDHGRLWPHFLIIEPMRGLSYITRTQLSKPNRNKIVHDDTHPIKTEGGFKITRRVIRYRGLFLGWEFFCYRTRSCSDWLSRIGTYQNSRRLNAFVLGL